MARVQFIFNLLRQSVRVYNKYWFCNSFEKRPKIQFNKVQRWTPIYFSGLLSYFIGEDPENKESELITIMKRGILATQREEFKKAEQLLHVALRIAQEQQNVEAITYCYDLLANLAFDTGDFVKAEKLYVTVVQRVLMAGKTELDNEVIHISLKLAKIYEERNDIEKAKLGYEYCLTQLEKKHKDQDESEDSLLLQVLVLHWYAKLLTAANETKKALEFLKKAHHLSNSINGEAHEQTILLLNDLGSVAYIDGDTETSLECIQKAVDLGRKVQDMVGFERLLINLGRLYYMKGMITESKQHCEEGWRLARETNNASSVAEAKQCLDDVLKANVI